MDASSSISVAQKTTAASAPPRPPAIAGTEERWLQLEGRRMRYLTCGAGAPLVLVHGLLGYSFSWRRNYEALGRVAQVYAPDALGVGFSERDATLDCSLGAQAERVLRFMDALGIRGATLVGTSHGGAVAVFAAARDQEQGGGRIARLAVVDGVNPWSRRGRLLVPLLAGPAGRALPWAVRTFTRTHGYWLARQYGDPRRIPAGTLEGYTQPLLVPGTIEHVRQILRCWRRDLREYEARLAGLANLPVLLVWGTADRAVYPESAHEVQRRLAGSRLVMLEGVGHLPYEESPEEFNQALLGFLKERAGGGHARRIEEGTA